jgi:hypothetical protein
VTVSAGAWLMVTAAILALAAGVPAGVLMARLGGWPALSRLYPPTREPTGARVRALCSMGRYGHNRWLSIAAGHRCLHLAGFALDRLGRPPISVPWPDVEVSIVRAWFGVRVRFELRQAPGIGIRLKPSVARRIAEMSGGRLGRQG